MGKPYHIDQPWVRNCIAGILPEQRARWEKRAKRIEEIARYMMHEASEQTDFDHPLTDDIDNVIHAVEELLDALTSPRAREKYYREKNPVDAPED